MTIQIYLVAGCSAATVSAALNQWVVFKQIFTSIGMAGPSINTPTTVAKAAPEDKPNSIVEVAMATSKWFEAPIMVAKVFQHLPCKSCPEPSPLIKGMF